MKEFSPPAPLSAIALAPAQATCSRVLGRHGLNPSARPARGSLAGMRIAKPQAWLRS